MFIRAMFAIAALLEGVASVAEAVPLRKLRRKIWRIEDRRGITVATFTGYKDAEKLGDPIEDILNPPLYPIFETVLDPTGKVVESGKVWSLEIPVAGSGRTTIMSGQPLEVWGSSKSPVDADKRADEELDYLNDDIANLKETCPDLRYAYGRFRNGHVGYYLCPNGEGDTSCFNDGEYGLSPISFNHAKYLFENGKKEKVGVL